MHMQANAEEAIQCFRQALHLYDIEVNTNAGFKKRLHRSDSTTATTVTMTTTTTSSSACSSSNNSVVVSPEGSTTTTPAAAEAEETTTPSPAITTTSNNTTNSNHTFDIAITLNDLAFCYMRLKRHDQAYQTYQKAYKLFKECCQIDEESKCIHMAATMRFLSLLSQESNSLLVQTTTTTTTTSNNGGGATTNTTARSNIASYI